MTSVFGVSILVLIVLLVFAALMFRLIRRVWGPVVAPSDGNLRWLFEFSVSRYKPMERLLSEEDFAYLESQPGYHPAIGRKLRAEHRRIFRMYLRRMVRDFNRIHAAARVMIVHSPVDASELAAVLFKQRITFLYAIAAVHGRLALHALGVKAPDVGTLILTLDTMRLQLCRFAAPMPELGRA